MKREYVFCILAVIIAFGLFLFPPQDIAIVRLTDAAIKLFEDAVKSENPYKLRSSFDLFQKVTALAPFSPVPRINLGNGYFANKQLAEAEREYLAANRFAGDKSQEEIRYLARFNAARAAGEQSHIDQALSYYQSALELQPESREVKVNIELLWQGQGSGQGQGEPKDNKEGEGDPNQNNPSNEGPEKKQKPQFQSKELTQDDVRKILEELKNQEQKIRAQEYSKGAKEKPREKDW